ncbi:hypothetical protein BBR47_33500 [Brevibacillus brevis NBRC 100599]|uniref:Uncharacterized protein n=1 Tax=Brevibacillus brevis (strain 47 / JCM 6285 / NBRC 100599) TaxID=358681 RepID=C0ZEW8_BREBN|nr:hypothetical protein BBR47_33500 [Brevibacillus brevis NBRC 100599]
MRLLIFCPQGVGLGGCRYGLCNMDTFHHGSSRNQWNPAWVGRAFKGNIAQQASADALQRADIEFIKRGVDDIRLDQKRKGNGSTN